MYYLTVEYSTVKANGFGMSDRQYNFNSINSLFKYAREYGRQTVKQYELSASEHQICMFLYYHKFVSQDDVAQNLLMDKTTVAKALDRLNAKNMVAREPDPSNKRKNRLFLLPNANNLVEGLVKLYDEWAKKVFSCLSQEEGEQFDNLSNRLCACAKIINEEGKNEQF